MLTLVAISSVWPFNGVPPVTDKVALVLSLPTVLPLATRPNSSYFIFEKSSEKVRGVNTFSIPSLSKAIETVEPSWITPSMTSSSNRVGDFNVAFNVKLVSRPSWRIQTLFWLAWTFDQRLDGLYVTSELLIEFFPFPNSRK